MGAYDCDCINNLEYDRRERKAQLSKEGTTKGTTSELISRQAAIDALDCISGVEEVLRSLPTIQPEPTDEQVAEYCKKRCLHIVTDDFFESTKPQRLGHWILYDKRFPWRHHYKCSGCGNYLDFSGVNGGRGEVNFCPNCGARMKGERQK